MNILIIYGSLEGQTQKISEYIAKILTEKGHQVTSLSGEQLPADFSVDQYEAVIIGGSIHMDRYPKYIKRFVTTHRDWLNKVPSAFFTVCMAIHSKTPKTQAEALLYGEHFLAQTGWQPRLNTTFSGAVKYTKYNFITRFIMKMISKREGGSTDTSRDHEYTDWSSVESFAAEFVGVATG